MMLDKLKNRTGFFAGRKIKQAERKLQELDREVENAQRILVEQESVIARARSKWGSFYSLR